MAINLDIGKTTLSDMENVVKDITIAAKSTEGAGDQEETEYFNYNWTKWFGIYKTIPEVKIAFDMRAIWTIGNGFKADPETTTILDHVSGWGNDTFNLILRNMIVTKRIGGDAFSEIIRDANSGTLLNLKPLDPGSMKIVVNRKGIIIRYEQINKVGKDRVSIKFKPDEIFHLVNKRIADEIHGVSDIEALNDIINASNSSFKISEDIVKKYAKPRLMTALDTDDQVKIDAFVKKFDDATNKGENLFYPKGSVDTPIVLSVPANSSLNILPWREHLRNYFYQVVGIPQIVLGNAAEFSESSAKIAYLAFEQSVDDEQNDIEAQVWNQLGLRIELSFPASLRNELLSDEAKDGETKQMTAEMNPAGVGE